MKKFQKLIVVCLLMCMPLVVKADEVIKKDKFDIVFGNEVKSENDVNGSALYAGNNVKFDKDVDGIGMFFGSNINIKGNNDYIVTAGMNISIDGIVEKDSFIFGNTIDIGKNFQGKRDITIFGNSVTLRGNIERDVIIYGSNVTIEDATINSKVTIYAQNIDIKDNVKIVGELGYNKDAKINIDSSSTIGSTVLLDKLMKETTFKDHVWSFTMQYASMLVVFLALVLIVPALFKRIENKNKDFSVFKLFVSIGFGALGLILVPIVFALLLTLIFGIPLALLLLVLYIIVICLTPIFSGYVLGNILFNKVFKKELNPLLVGLVGITIVMLLSIIPVIGVFVTLLSMLLGLGTVGYLFKKD